MKVQKLLERLESMPPDAEVVMPDQGVGGSVAVDQVELIPGEGVHPAWVSLWPEDVA